MICFVLHLVLRPSPRRVCGLQERLHKGDRGTSPTTLGQQEILHISIALYTERRGMTRLNIIRDQRKEMEKKQRPTLRPYPFLRLPHNPFIHPAGSRCLYILPIHNQISQGNEGGALLSGGPPGGPEFRRPSQSSWRVEASLSPLQWSKTCDRVIRLC
jgi:hypothetical protein